MKLDLEKKPEAYRTADGKRCPGVTTVLGAIDKSALVGWAADMEREGILAHAKALADEPFAFSGDLVAALATGLPEERFHVTARDRAADLGTITHARIEAWLRGEGLDTEGLPDDLYSESIHGFERFREWWFTEDLTTVAVETRLVSEKWRCGGQMDVMARDPAGNLVLIDIKTTKHNDSWPYPTVIGQVAAYAAIWQETNTEPVSRVAVARVGKEAGDPGTRLWVDPRRLVQGVELFEGALVCYRAMLALGRKL